MKFSEDMARRLAELRQAGLFKAERAIASAQGAVVQFAGDQNAINLCANSYLGLSGHPDLTMAGQKALDDFGYGMSSVRFICGTHEVHKKLERQLAQFLGMEDAILYASCFDANTGLFETILDGNDAILSDSLNHASIIDGVRLCKAKRFRYANSNMADLEAKLIEAAGCRYRLIATDGVFSMDGYIAKLEAICDLAERHDAMVMVDDSHAVGFMGPGGRGTPEHCGVMGRVDILTGTLGKALGGAMGGYTAGKANVVEWLRQRSRPYLFSNSLAPMITATSSKVLDMIQANPKLRNRLHRNTRYFRDALTKLGFDLLAGEHPIIPIMLRDPKLAQDMAARLFDKGVFVTAFSFPVVPKGQDRIRTQMSAAHSTAQLDLALSAFAAVGRDLKVIT